MIETREQDQRVQQLAFVYPHGVGILDLHEALHKGQLAHAALITCHDAQARPVHREIMLPDGTRFVEVPADIDVFAARDAAELIDGDDDAFPDGAADAIRALIRLA